MKKTFYTIYLLVDPRDHKPFYIGQTSNIKRRYYRQHWNPSDDDKTDRAKQIREILKAGRKPNLVILERTTRKVSALIREMYWIETFKRSGATLKNQENQKWLLEQYDELTKQIRQTPRAANWHPHPYGVGCGYMEFQVILHKSEYGYDIHVPVLSGCASQGDTEQEAIENIKDAIKTYLEMETDEIKKSAQDIQVRAVEIAFT